MAYEIDTIGVPHDQAAKDADAICLRWKAEMNDSDVSEYQVGVIDGGFEAHGDAMVKHMNTYYFDDPYERKDSSEKIVDFVVVTHPDIDHVLGLKSVLDKFCVKRLYMNRPWLYAEELFPHVDDGRITVESLERRLREKYTAIADIEEIANERGIQVYEAFQGTRIENALEVLSPSRGFYLEMLIESEKTPLETKGVTGHGIDGYVKHASQVVRQAPLSLAETWSEELLQEDVSTSAENESSVVLRGEVDGSGFLLVGDAGIRALGKAMDFAEENGRDLRDSVSYYQIPHHGGRHNVSPSVLNRMLGPVVIEGVSTGKSAFASAAEDSDHPLKMVTNAYLRRGVKVFRTHGATLHHHVDMPDRSWGPALPIDFSKWVEEWDS